MRNMVGLSRAIEITASKRRMQVLCCLLAGQGRFNELKKGCVDISSAELARVLNYFVDKGIVTKVQDAGHGRIEYMLTKKGRMSSGVLQALERWGSAL